MSRKDDLEKSIRESYSIIVEDEDIRRLSNWPEEKRRAERNIQKHWELIRNDLSEYEHLVNGAYPPDIAEIASHFDDGSQLGKKGDDEYLKRHVRHLKDMLNNHRSNLYVLEQQKVPYGIDVPLHIINSIKHEEAEIEHIKRELDSLDQ